MVLELRTITFNHDLSSASTSALNIRRNKDFEVLLPEYDAALPTPSAESRAAYAIAETKGQPAFIRVAFRITSPAHITYHVKATYGGVMGALDSQQVTFSGGATEQTVDFPLTHRDFSRIGRHDITWQWMYRQGGNPNWQNLGSTSHRIYLIIALPPLPWTQAVGNKRNPWTDLLDVCCVVASGSQDAPTAVERITKSVHSTYALRYDIESGAPRYGFWVTGSSFDLTRWIDYVLRGNAPATPKFCAGSPEEYKDFWIVNCYDCAAACALMAKAVGAQTDYYYHKPFGYLKYVEPIGRGKCNNPFYGCFGNNPEVGPDAPRTGFGNHAYQKFGGSTNYDATMREWLPLWLKILLFLIWLLVLIFTLGQVNLKQLMNRSGGWLVDLTQTEYDSRTIDVSQPFEAAAAGGSPALQTLQFQVA